jgi:uncharacterized DUF497 family protein
MTYEWDEQKRKMNIIKHGLDFYVAVFVFDDPNKIEMIDNRKDYGEERKIVLGKVNDDIIIVVYTMRGENIRVISVRPAKQKERRIYYGNC